MRTLWTTKALCAAVSARYNLSNNNQLAVKIGTHPSTTLNWSRGGIMDETHVPTFAALLDEDEGWISLCLAVERVKSDKLAEKMRAVLLADANRVASFALGFLVVASAYCGHYYIA